MNSATAIPTARRGDTLRKPLLARLHCIKRDRCWSDDEYRDILQNLSGKRSAADLELPELARVVATLGGQTARAGGAGFADGRFPLIIASATADKKPLLRKIAAVCGALGVDAGYAEGIAKRQSRGVDRRLEMMSYDELYKVAAALVNTQRARSRKSASARPTRGKSA